MQKLGHAPAREAKDLNYILLYLYIYQRVMPATKKPATS